MAPDDALGVNTDNTPTFQTETESSVQKLARINAYLKGSLPDSPRPVRATVKIRQSFVNEAAKRSGIATTHMLSPILERSSPLTSPTPDAAMDIADDIDNEDPDDTQPGPSPQRSMGATLDEDEDDIAGSGLEEKEMEDHELEGDAEMTDEEEEPEVGLPTGKATTDTPDREASPEQQEEASPPPRTPARKTRRRPDPPSPSLSPSFPKPSTLPTFQKKNKKAETARDPSVPVEPVQSPPWQVARKPSRSKGKVAEAKRKHSDSPELPEPTGPDDLLAQARAAAPKPMKRVKVDEPDAARVPHKFSLDGPVVHDKSTLNQKLRESMRRVPAPLPRHPAYRPVNATGGPSAPTPTAATLSRTEESATLGIESTVKDGPPPSQATYTFSPVPPGGYAVIQGPSPGWAYENMDDSSIAYYGKKKSGKVVGIMYGYTFAEAQSALGGTSVAGVACAMIASYLKIDARTLKAANPVPIANLSHPRNGPWGVLIYGLSKTQETRLTKRQCLATEGTALLLLAVTPHFAEHQVNLSGPYNKEAETIRILVHKKLRLPENRAALAEIARRALPDDTRSDRKLTRDIIKSVVVTRLESHAKGGHEDPSYNVALPPLCDDVTIWHEVNDLFRRIDYSCEYSQVLVSERMRCPGCHGVDHYGGLCTYDKTEHWDGPPAAIVAITEAAARKAQGSANRGRRNYY